MGMVPGSKTVITVNESNHPDIPRHPINIVAIAHHRGIRSTWVRRE
jgi:hypothetical protein